jgi:1-acyl-sn-glycerol-3-phosphate acyltransferase
VEFLHLLRTVFYLIPIIGAYTILAGTSSVVSMLWDPTGCAAHRVAQIWGRAILWTTGVRVEVRGLELLTPGATYIFVANHQSIYDIPVVFHCLRYQLRIIAKESLGRFPFIGMHLRRTGHILVDRQHPDRGAILRHWKSLLQRSLSLIVFAEGTRSADGQVGRFKPGAFVPAIQAGLPIVPVAIVGSRYVMRKGYLTTRPGFVEMTIHPPVRTDTGDWEQTVDGARRLASHVQQIVADTVTASEKARTPWPSR